jgi:capsular polysaccharide biosynthesis protein
MSQWMSKMLDRISESLAHRKGLLPLLGILLVAANFIVQFFVPGWFGSSNLLLHLGLVIAILGLMLARAL